MSRRIALAVLVATIATLAGGQAASASQGSVPAEVAAYAADPEGLLAAVDDVAGVGADGKGITLDDTAKVGQLNRVFVFTPAFLAGDETETPVERTNEWTAPIELGGKPLGLATIWINPASVAPELGSFAVGATIGAALRDVPADAYLVRDESHGAWFTLVGEDLTPLVAGTTGLDGATALADYQRSLLAEAAAVEPAPQSIAPLLSLAVIIVSILVIAAVLVAPVLRQRRRARPAEAAIVTEPEPGPEPEPEPKRERMPEPAPATTPTKALVKAPTTAPGKAVATRSQSTPTAKPVTESAAATAGSAAPAKTAPAKSGAVKPKPAASQTKGAPAKGTPAEGAAAKGAPAKGTPAKTTPARTTPAKPSSTARQAAPRKPKPASTSE